MKLIDRFIQCKTHKADIHEHMDTLLKYGKKVDTITEMGVRAGVSTAAWILAAPKKLTCYDIQHARGFVLENYKRWATEQDVDFTFNIADTRKIEIEPTELLFIDTLHTYDQLKIELKLHADKVSKYIIFHDTVTFGSVGMVGDKIGLMPAIEEFLSEHPEWEEKEHYRNCNGLLIIERV